MTFLIQSRVGLLVVILHFLNLLPALDYCIEKLMENLAVEQPGKSLKVNQ